MQEYDLALVEQRPVTVIGRDDGEFGAVERDVPLEQRQGALADRAEAEHHDGAVEAGEQRRVFHWRYSG